MVRDTGDLPEPVAYPTTSFAAEQDRLHGERDAAYAPTAQTAQPAHYPQHNFGPPPVPPRKKSNRGVGALIAILSVILFAVVYAVIAAVIIGFRTPQGLGNTFMTFAANPVFYVPAIIFVIAFVLVVLLANRASWWAYVLGSLLVGALVYFGTIGVALLSVNVLDAHPQRGSHQVHELCGRPIHHHCRARRTRGVAVDRSGDRRAGSPHEGEERRGTRRVRPRRSRAPRGV